jgi:hypothetical protein
MSWKEKLEREGHRIIPKGRRYAVAEYERSLAVLGAGGR